MKTKVTKKHEDFAQKAGCIPSGYGWHSRIAELAAEVFPAKQLIYNEDTPTEPGMYLGLFHGRETLTEDMNDWGTNGPILGPLNWCHTTYAHDVKCQFVDGDEDFFFEMKEGCLFYDGVWYGDWTVFYHKGGDDKV